MRAFQVAGLVHAFMAMIPPPRRNNTTAADEGRALALPKFPPGSLAGSMLATNLPVARHLRSLSSGSLPLSSLAVSRGSSSHGNRDHFVIARLAHEPVPAYTKVTSKLADP